MAKKKVVHEEVEEVVHEEVQPEVKAVCKNCDDSGRESWVVSCEWDNTLTAGSWKLYKWRMKSEEWKVRSEQWATRSYQLEVNKSPL